MGAGLADRFVAAVEQCWPGAVPVAEQAAGLAAEPVHTRPFRHRGQHGPRLGVEFFDLRGDSEVFVGDGAVGDSGVGHGHRQ